jgi:hypothetical protein
MHNKFVIRDSKAHGFHETVTMGVPYISNFLLSLNTKHGADFEHLSFV